MIDERLAVYVDSMRNAVVRAITLASRMTESSFGDDHDAQAATSMYLVAIGENAIKISQQYPEFVSAHDDWPWALMRGLRNRIVHGYDTLSVPMIWSTATQSLPALLKQINAVVEPRPPHNPT